MKNFFLAFLMFSFVVIASAIEPRETRVITNTEQSENVAEIKFDTLSYDFGKFSASDPIVKCTFTFTNIGNAPLVIKQVVASCGCTVATYTNRPVMPGETGTVYVTYNGTGKFPGHFRKTITVRSNAKTEMLRLSISGEMTEE